MKIIHWNYTTLLKWIINTLLFGENKLLVNRENMTLSEQVKKNICEHKYKYSHAEQFPTQTPSSAMPILEIVDVCVCTKCGDVKRTKQ